MVGDKFTVPLARENYDRYEKLPRFSEKLDAKAAEKVKVKAMAENPDGTLTEVELPDDVGPPRLELLKDEIKIEVEVLSSGNVSATLIRPYDTKNNKKIEDGRIEVRDQFIFDPMMNTLLRDEANELRCHHTVKWNQRGIDKQGWLTREKMMDSVRQAPDKVVEDIALNVVRAFPRPFLKEHRQYLNEHLDFNLPVIERAAKLGLIIDTTHPGTHYSIVRPGGVIEMIFSYAYRKEGIPGYLVVQDTFTQGGFGFHCRREAKPGRGFENNEDWRNLAEQLNPLPQPDPGAATRFMRDYLKEGEFRGKLFELSLYKIASPSTDKPPLEAPQEIVIQDFHQVMEDRIVEEQAIPLAEISPEFFQALEDNKVHFQPLQEALGPEFSIDFRNPELAVTTRFENGKTCIYFKFSIRSQEENGPKGVVEYRERWIYNEQGWLEAINPSVRSYGTEADSSLDLAGQRIRAAITEGKFRQPESAADFTSLALLLPFVAPHLSYAGYLKNLDRKDAEILGETSSKMPIVERKIRTQLFREPFEILEKIQKELLPLLQQEESENFSFRFGLARALAALQHYDQRSRRPFLAPALRELEQIKKIENENYENATQAVQDVEKIRDQALRAKKRLAALEEKNRCFDRRQLIEMIAAIAKRDMKKAEIHMQALHSPALKRVCQEPIEAFLRKEKAVEDFEILRVIEKDRIARRSHESKRLIGGGPSVDVEAENQRLESVLAKASNYARIYGAKDSLATLREAADFLQDSQSRALTQLESELKMTAEERSFALRLGEDKLMSHVLSIAGRRDKGQKASELFLFVKTQLYDKGLPNAAKWLTAQISRHYLPKSRALESLQVIRQISSEQIAKKHAQKLADLTEAMPQSGVNVDFDSLIKKLGAQAQKNPKLDVAALLKSLDALQGKEKLSDAEKKIRDEILAFPLIQALNAAAQLSDVEQRFQLYWNEILQGLPIQSQQDPRLLRDLQTRLGAIAQVAATTEAPAVEGAAIIAMRYNSYFVRKQEEAEAFVLDGLQKKMAAALAPENQKNLQKDPLLVLDEILPIPESEREVDLLRKKIINTFDGLGLRQKIADAAAISTLPERMEAYRKLASDLILELNSLLKQLQQEPLRDIQ
ncbi:MAG TPA: hypothetical protein DF383_08590, partial [Deltaproteobacteria bacterium]|nr:hypothetical protein [Deltaproteobacteria bacterium]